MLYSDCRLLRTVVRTELEDREDKARLLWSSPECRSSIASSVTTATIVLVEQAWVA